MRMVGAIFVMQCLCTDAAKEMSEICCHIQVGWLVVFGSDSFSLARYAGNRSARAAPDVLIKGPLSLRVLS